MKEEFDDILKRKWAGQYFPVDEQHREQMIALLDQKKRRRIIPFWWLGGLGLATIVAGYFLFTAQPSWPNETAKPDVGVNSVNTSSGKADVPSNSNQKRTEVKAGLNTETISPEGQSSSFDRNTGSSHQADKTIMKAETTKEQPVKAKTEPVYPKKSDVNTTSSRPTGSIKAGHTPSGTPVITDGSFRVDEEAARSYQIVSKTTAVTIEPETREYIEIEDILLPDFAGIGYSSKVLPVQITPTTAYHKSFYLFGETGVGMILASQPDFSTGWKFRAGGGLGYKVSPKTQFSLSLGYLLQSGGFDFQRSSTVDYPGFGTRSNINTLTPDKLHYVYSRLGVQYRIKRHILGMHGGFQYLYGSQGDIVTQVQDQFATGITETAEYAWLVTDGLRKMHWTADLSYGYHIAPRWFVTAGADFYFSSLTVEDEVLTQDGYYWSGAYTPVHPFITLNFMIYAGR